MATLYTEQSKNIKRTWILMTSFFVVIILLGWWLDYCFNNIYFLIVAVFVSILLNFIAYFQSDKIALSASGAVLADEKKYPELYQIVENLCITVGMPRPKIYIIKDASPNAFATGRDDKHSSIAYTTGLLEILNRSEIEGVTAHELAHIRNRDILVATVVVVLVGIIAVVCDLAIRMSFRSSSNNNKGGVVVLIIGVVGVILAPVVAKIIQLSISRRREFLADASGALMTRYPEGLASALEKISNIAKPMKKVSTATAHLFITDPFAQPLQSNAKNSNLAQKDRGWFSHLFDTHPPTEERVKALLRHQ